MKKAGPLFILAAVLSALLVLAGLHFNRRSREHKACQAALAAVSDLAYSLTRQGADSEAAFARSRAAMDALEGEWKSGWISEHLHSIGPLVSRMRGKEAAGLIPALTPELESFRDEIAERRGLTFREILEMNALITSLKELKT